MEKEEIKKLLERFMEAKKAGQATEDIWYGEQLLSEHPATEPDEDLVRRVKAAVRMRLAEEETKTKHIQVIFKAAAIAAVLAIFSFIGMFLLDQEEKLQGPIAGRSDTLWESEDLFAGDNKLMVLDTEIKQIRNELTILERGGTGSNGAQALHDIETELIVFAGDFWER
ncbi:MAG: hypothetical protein ACYTFM_03565 [Planctomycetota bacterium]|jgi:hypothetical protein